MSLLGRRLYGGVLAGLGRVRRGYLTSPRARGRDGDTGDAMHLLYQQIKVTP